MLLILACDELGVSAALQNGLWEDEVVVGTMTPGAQERLAHTVLHVHGGAAPQPEERGGMVWCGEDGLQRTWLLPLEHPSMCALLPRVTSLFLHRTDLPSSWSLLPALRAVYATTSCMPCVPRELADLAILVDGYGPNGELVEPADDDGDTGSDAGSSDSL